VIDYRWGVRRRYRAVARLSAGAAAASQAWDVNGWIEPVS
jgi:hypothetical protein